MRRLHSINIRLLASVVLAVIFSNSLLAQLTQWQYLSGTGPQDAVPWEFYCTEGRNSNQWTTIPVPSNWEFHGFGKYNYGHDKDKGKEEGLYRHRFVLPADAKGKKVYIVFEGSMTDTYVKINGKEAGPVHQGAFYRFQYDITKLLKPGKENLLEVRVAKHSANESVNRAEREADYWIFGGIYRPVYLRTMPVAHIQRLAIDAKANGALKVQGYVEGIGKGLQIHTEVQTLDGKTVGGKAVATLQAGDTIATLQAAVSTPTPWHAEAPYLYKLVATLTDISGKVVHQVEEKIGFRTVELRKGDGIYINNTKVILKGVNRHCTWPTTGKALTYEQSLQDALLIKRMNMNAVRMSHYPPDKHFLEICDSLGLYVLNELAGWQKSYDTAVGTRLVKELVTRDVNHPSVILWANGNEGGWNRGIIPEFARWDIQQRQVYLPWERFDKLETKHYPDYNYVANSVLYENDIFMPTEFMHGLYDGGHGAGLEDFWNAMMQKRNLGGGFLWVFADEGIVRTDKNDSIDAKGNQGADGIVGPFREKEASFFTIRDIWSPVQITTPVLHENWNRSIFIENRYHFTNLSECTIRWKLATADFLEKASGTLQSHALEPGEKKGFELLLPNNWQEADLLIVQVFDKHGQEITSCSWPVASPMVMAQRRWSHKDLSAAIQAAINGANLSISQGDIMYTFDTLTGTLQGVQKGVTHFPLRNGPVLAGFEDLTKLQWQHGKNEQGYFVKVLYGGKATLEIIWQFRPMQPVQMRYRYVQLGEHDFRGISFHFPEEQIKEVSWLGMGPYRVWKNRMRGTEFGTWNTRHNNTITGESWVYPEFKGYFGEMYEASFSTPAGSIHVYTKQNPFFLQVLKPAPPKGAYNNHNAPEFPKGDIGFLQAIAPIGTKFQPAQVMGPQSQKNVYLGTTSLTAAQREAPNKLPFFTPVEGDLWFVFTTGD